MLYQESSCLLRTTSHTTGKKCWVVTMGGATTRRPTRAAMGTRLTRDGPNISVCINPSVLNCVRGGAVCPYTTTRTIGHSSIGVTARGCPNITSFVVSITRLGAAPRGTGTHNRTVLTCTQVLTGSGWKKLRAVTSRNVGIDHTSATITAPGTTAYNVPFIINATPLSGTANATTATNAPILYADHARTRRRLNCSSS